MGPAWPPQLALADFQLAAGRDFTRRRIGAVPASIAGGCGTRFAMAEPTREDIARLQSQLAAIVESSDDAIVSKTLDGTIVTWNQGAERIFGYTAQEVIGRPINVIIPDDRQGEETLILKRLCRGERVDHFETVRRAKDGRLVDVSVTISPMRDAGGTIVGASKIARDIGAQKRFQRELEAAKAAAEEANRAKDQFLSVLSHELRTPLTPALASLSFLENQAQLPEEVRPQIGMARRNIETEARLVDDLLDLTRITRGKMRLHFEIVDAHAALRSAIAMLQSEIDEKSLDLSLGLRARRAHVWADAGRMQQIFLNLLSNAIKFTPEGGTVSLRTRNDEDGNGQGLRIQVSDTGMGIEPDVLGRLFVPFEQSGEARRFGGLGLGLSITKSLVTMHGGTIAAASEGRDRGATFTIELPTAEMAARSAPGLMPADVPAPAGAMPQAPAGPLPPRRRCRILLVEDHADTRQIMTKVLRSFDCEVTTAGGVREALAMADRGEFDLLVSDIGLSDGSGLDVMRALRDRSGDIHGIAISGYGQDEDLRRSREAGFQQYLIKPVNFQALRDAVTKAVAAAS